MIYILQGGRCGNQLFNYAFARQIQYKYPEQKICVCASGLEKKQGEYGSFWEDSLKHFNVSPYETWRGNDVDCLKQGTLSQRMAWNLWGIVAKLDRRKITPFSSEVFKRKMFKMFSKSGVYYNIFDGAASYDIARHENYFVYGKFEDEKWFEEQHDNLCEELRPKVDKLPNAELMQQIKTLNSVCVSLRNWTIDVTDQKNLTNRTICDAEYYRKAIQYMKNHVENPAFIVFSDDVEWGKQIVSSVAGDSVVIAESNLNNVAEKLRYMSACKHFILANSTFSWWAQYLARNESKIVVSPSRWFHSKEQHPLINKKWVLL